jgi:hypothetical protein
MKKLLIVFVLGLLFRGLSAQIGDEGGRRPKMPLKVTGSVQGAEGNLIANAIVRVYSMSDTFFKEPTMEQLATLPNEVIAAMLAQVKTNDRGLFNLELSFPLFKLNSIDNTDRRAFRKFATSAYLIVNADGYETMKAYVNWRPERGENGFELLLEPIVLLKLKDKIGGVEIKTKLIVQKGDTTEMNAGNFQVNPDASAEDLVRKMPGVTSSNGQIQAQGEQVKKVLVDGKPFFGDDPNSALKNLPADVISKIQIYDGKSDQSAFTGFDDGNTSKTMNIITKMGFKNGMFGKAFGGYGRSFDGTGEVNKYKAGLNVNYFAGDRRFTLLSQFNNINEQNFSIDDIMGSMGSGGRGGRGQGGMGGMFGGAGGGASNFFAGNQNGINTTNAVGLNFSDKWGKLKNVEFSSSYFFNRTITDNSSQTQRFYVTGSKNQPGLNYFENDSSLTTNVNHRFNFRIDWKIDSLNKLIVQPRLTIQSTEKNNPLFGNTFNPESSLSFRNTLNNLILNNSNGLNGGLNLNWLHSYSKKGRTLSVNVNPGFTNQTGINKITNETEIILGSLYTDTVKLQRINTEKLGMTLSANATFTEGLDSNQLLAFSYNLNYNLNGSDRLNNTPISRYSDIYNVDTGLSSRFNNGYVSHSIGTQYQYQNYKWNTSIGVNGQVASLSGDQEFPFLTSVNKYFYSVLPNVSIRYKVGMKKNLRLNYRASNNAPSVDQLQEVVNNSNIQQLTIGNQKLDQDFQHNITLRYFSVDMEKSSNQFFLINATYTNNYITSLTQIANNGPLEVMLGDTSKLRLNPGSQISQSINMDGYYSLRLFGTYGRPFLKGKLNMNMNAGLNFTQTPSMLKIGLDEAKANYARNPTGSLGIVLGTNLSKVDLTMMSTTTINFVSNTLQRSMDQNYINQNSQLRITINPTNKWVISSDITHQLYSGITTTLNQSFYLFNIGLGKKFGKGNQSEFRLTVYDLFNQNRAISRNVTQAYFEDVRTKVLTRYAMITYTYTLKQLGAKSDEKDKKMMMFPGGMPMPGGMPHGGGF